MPRVTVRTDPLGHDTSAHRGALRNATLRGYSL